jgi:hypothetical protein
LIILSELVLAKKNTLSSESLYEKQDRKMGNDSEAFRSFSAGIGTWDMDSDGDDAASDA